MNSKCNYAKENVITALRSRNYNVTNDGQIVLNGKDLKDIMGIVPSRKEMLIHRSKEYVKMPIILRQYSDLTVVGKLSDVLPAIIINRYRIDNDKVTDKLISDLEGAYRNEMIQYKKYTSLKLEFENGGNREGLIIPIAINRLLIEPALLDW